MKLKLFLKFSIILLIGFNSFCMCLFDGDVKSIDTTIDPDLHCRQFDFETKLNISVGTNITIVYNSSLCKKCIQKLLLFKGLQNRFEQASYNELTFIMLTMEYRGTEQFKELQNRAGNIILLSLHEISNEFFLPKSFYIFDKCSRLTYELTSPYAEVQNQIVKAAILSTWYDSPCGHCNADAIDNPFYPDDNYISSDEIDDLQQTTTISVQTSEPSFFTNIDENMNFDYHDVIDDDEEDKKRLGDELYVIPLKIIIPSEHVHLENNNYINNTTETNYTKYNYFILNSNDSSYHEHFEYDNQETLQIRNSVHNSNARGEVILNNDQELVDDNPIIDIRLINEEGLNFEIIKNYSILDKDENLIMEYQEVAPVKAEAIITIPNEERSEKDFRDVKNNTSVYSALHPWISFRLRQLI